MSQVRPIDTRLVHFEDALYKTGWGLYYKFLVGFTAANLFSNGLVLLCIYFAIPLSACDTLLSKDDIITIHICFSAGKALGGFILCSISDNTGKKCMISKSLIIIFGSCFISAFSHNVYTLYLAALFLGSGLQANIVTMKIYLAEILPIRSRGFYMVLPDLFWTIGYFCTALFIYFCGLNNANVTEHQGMDMRLTSWRIIFAAGGGLCITMGCTSALLELSPRYLLFKRRIITASLVLKQFYAINKSKYSETFDIHSQQLYDLISDYNINIDPEPVGLVQQLVTIVKVMLRMLRVLFRKRFFKILFVITIIKISLFSGIPGLNIFLSQNIKKASKQVNQVNGTSFLHLTLYYDQQNCTVSLDQTEFEYFLILSTNILLGQIILLFIIDRIGRKFPIFAGLTFCSLASLVLAFNQNFIISAVVASIFMISYTLIESTIYVVLIESFPTAVRGTAIGVTHFYVCLVSCFVYKFLHLNCQTFLTIMGAVLLGSSILSCFIPDLCRRPMIE